MVWLLSRPLPRWAIFLAKYLAKAEHAGGEFVLSPRSVSTLVFDR